LFEIKCLRCGEKVVINDKTDQNIRLEGQSEAMYDVDVYITCRCGNKYTVENE
jgi:DNA-directed RNA polymerase subunit RPC12/RpoP